MSISPLGSPALVDGRRWGDGEGMYLEGERGDWTGWGAGRLELEESAKLGEGASQDQTWGMYGLEAGRFGEKEVEKRLWDSQAELEELDTLRRGGRRRWRRRKRPRPEKENPPPEAGGFEELTDECDLHLS